MTEFEVFEKPNGISSHAQDTDRVGFTEYLQHKLDTRYYIVHRLDKATSGLLLLAKDAKSAAHLTQLFTEHTIKKTYYFITDRRVEQHSFHVKSHIEKISNQFISKYDEPPNAETVFTKLNQQGQYSLWQAEPKTGKPHQIRLHAEQCKIPILGDNLHGGSPYFRLCLHAVELEVPIESSVRIFKSEAPAFFKDLNILPNEELCLWLNSAHNRQLMLKWQQQHDESFRLVHLESPQLRIDKYGSVLWVYDYNTQALATKNFREMTQQLEIPFAFYQHMQNRGAAPNTMSLSSLNNPPPRWMASEEHIKYELRSDCGLSPGLFLDQRANRRWLKQNAQKKSVLNLFAYTGGFSLNAALGGASQVCTVDLSKTFIDWSKHNFTLNGLKPENYEFWQADALQYVRGAVKRGKKFDIIVCDPPSFSRNQNKVFRIENELAPLVHQLLELLNKPGVLLFCTNFEKWTQKEFIKLLESIAHTHHAQVSPTPLADFDFWSPDQEPQMKSAFISFS